MSINCDGSPHAYAPIDSGLPALDYLANAGNRGNWYGIACDSSGNPYIQTSTDPAPGFYVSTTALQDASYAVHDPRRYVDSETIPYIVIPGHFPARLGDLARVEYRGQTVTAIVADVGPRNHYGEGSIALANLLSIPSSPKHGGVDGGVTYYIYANSSRGWWRDWKDIEQQMSEITQ